MKPFSPLSHRAWRDPFAETRVRVGGRGGVVARLRFVMCARAKRPMRACHSARRPLAVALCVRV
eukprot:6187045-Pleurochrysis_carterae.AAC.1